jgi:hypothetical protein
MLDSVECFIHDSRFLEFNGQSVFVSFAIVDDNAIIDAPYAAENGTNAYPLAEWTCHQGERALYFYTATGVLAITRRVGRLKLDRSDIELAASKDPGSSNS